jgi:hypothetical protein
MRREHSTAFRIVLAATLFGLVVMVTLAAVLGIMAASDDPQASAQPRELVVQPTANAAPAEPTAAPPAKTPPPVTAESEPPVVTTGSTESEPLSRGRLEPGRYAVERFDPDFSVTFESGWRTHGDGAQVVELTRGGGRNLSVLRAPSHVFVPGTLETRPAPTDMLGWMRDHTCVIAATEPAPVTVGGNDGLQMEFSIRADPGCSGPYWEIDEGRVYTFEAGESDRLIALTVNAQGGLHELLVNVSTVAPAHFAAFVRKSTKVLATIEFG